MNLFHRKSKFEKVMETLESNEVLKSAARNAVRSAVANSSSPKQAAKVDEAIQSFDFAKPARKAGGFRKMVRSGVVVGAGIAAVTALSATVSAARHREGST